LKIEAAARYKASQSSCGASGKVAFAFASGIAARLRCVESDKADCLPANADGVGVDHLHGAGRDRLGSSWRRQRGEGKSYGGGGAHVRYRKEIPRGVGGCAGRAGYPGDVGVGETNEGVSIPG
jgi:hypothetical protein